MSILKVLITTVFTVVAPVAALAQSAPVPTQPTHQCGMMAAKHQVTPAGPAAEGAPPAEATPMACCLSKAADHPAHAGMTPPAAAPPMAGMGKGTMEGAAASCCGAQMTPGEKMAPEERMAARERMAAGAGKEECCCAKTPRP